MDSKKLKRDAEIANVGIANEEAKTAASAKTEANKTQFTEKQATGRTGMQIAAQKEIAAMPPAEQKLLQAVYDQEKAKNPDITMLEVYNKMHPGALSAQNTPQELVFKYTKEWNDLLGDPAAMRAFKKANPKVETLQDYVKTQMELGQSYVTNRPSVVNPPPASSGTAGTNNVRSQADAILSGS
jgi:hypothetical protein